MLPLPPSLTASGYIFACLLLLLLLLYEELSGYCRNEDASSLSFPRGKFPKLPRPLFGNPATSPKRGPKFCAPPHDGFAFLAEHPRR
jgi:hypothetical protein